VSAPPCTHPQAFAHLPFTSSKLLELNLAKMVAKLAKKETTAEIKQLCDSLQERWRQQAEKEEAGRQELMARRAREEAERTEVARKAEEVRKTEEARTFLRNAGIVFNEVDHAAFVTAVQPVYDASAASPAIADYLARIQAE